VAAMSIEKKLDDDLKSAMRARNQELTACIRQLRSKVQEAQNAPGFAGPSDDAFYQKVITSYAKSLEKGISELEQAGERGKPLRDKYRAEIDYLGQYLPKLLGEDQTRALVTEAVAKLGGARNVGAVVGAIMKEHKGDVDPALVRKLVEAALAGSTPG
jgi:uncharacterized protein YqeY